MKKIAVLLALSVIIAAVIVFVPWRVVTVELGETLEFGGRNWLVLDLQDNHALLIAENTYMIRDGRYHHTRGPMTWNGSSTRHYLNNDFLQNFTPAETARIRETYVINTDNPWFGSVGGANTMDKIFILNIEEIVQYFGDSGLLNNRPDGTRWLTDEYNPARIARCDEGISRWWWTRSAGVYQHLASGVDPTGTLSLYGTGVSNTTGEVRPVLWINLRTSIWQGSPLRSVEPTAPPPPVEEYVAAVEELYIPEEPEPEEPEKIPTRTITPRDWDNFAWELEYFSDIRQPLYMAYYTPLGYVAIQHLHFISDNLYGRKPFSYREKEAAAWLVEELLAMGHPWENIHIQEFHVYGDPNATGGAGSAWWNLTNQARWQSDFELRYTRISQNIVVTIPGQTSQKIIVGAHYDSWPTPGAADNASGTALLLESTQRMLDADNYYTIVYIFFGAEEVGLLGARHFVGSLTYEEESSIVLMINADSLIDGPYMIYGTAYNDNALPGANDITRRVDAVAYELNLDILGHPPASFLGSDQLPFLMRGHTIVTLMGLYRTELPGITGFFGIDESQFTRGVSHSQNDCVHFIENRWPGKIETSMSTFAVFLDALLAVRW